VTRLAPLLAPLAIALSGCTASPPLVDGLPADAPRSIELAATPFFPQEDFQCGPAALATVLVASGIAVTPEALAAEVFIPERRGSLAIELIGAARRHGRLPYVLALYSISFDYVEQFSLNCESRFTLTKVLKLN
jgi:hypothetical protein